MGREWHLGWDIYIKKEDRHCNKTGLGCSRQNSKGKSSEMGWIHCHVQGMKRLKRWASVGVKSKEQVEAISPKALKATWRSQNFIFLQWEGIRRHCHKKMTWCDICICCTMKYSGLRVLSTTKEKLENGQISILIKTHSQRYLQKCGNEGAFGLTITLIKNATNKNNSIVLLKNPICYSFPVQTRDPFMEEDSPSSQRAANSISQADHSTWQRNICRWGDQDIFHPKGDIYESGRVLWIITSEQVNGNCTRYLGCRVTLDFGLSLNSYQTNYMAGNKLSPFLRLNFFIKPMKWLHFSHWLNSNYQRVLLERQKNKVHFTLTV